MSWAARVFHIWKRWAGERHRTSLISPTPKPCRKIIPDVPHSRWIQSNRLRWIWTESSLFSCFFQCQGSLVAKVPEIGWLVTCHVTPLFHAEKEGFLKFQDFNSPYCPRSFFFKVVNSVKRYWDAPAIRKTVCWNLILLRLKTCGPKNLKHQWSSPHLSPHELTWLH